MALQWRVAHACNAAQGQWVEDEQVVAADIVTSEGRVTRGRIMGGRVQELDDGRLVFAGEYPCRFGTAIDGRCVLQDVARLPSRVTRVQAGAGGRVERAHHLPPPAAATLRVYVAAAPGKGEGLFAKISLEKGEVVAFYDGGTAAAA